MERWQAAIRRRRAEHAAAARRRSRLGLGLGLLGACASLPLLAQDLSPFKASYAVIWKGVTAGSSSLELQHLEADRWRYESHNAARGIFRLVLPGDITQVSTLRLGEDQVLPERYYGDDGTGNAKRHIDVSFDWRSGRASGMYEGVAVDLAIQPGVLDDLSVQVALMYELLRGKTPNGFRLLDKNQIKDYQYTRERSEQIDTALGKRSTVVYRSRKIGSRASTLFWCAPDLGFLPLRVERHDGDDRIEWSMAVLTASRP